MTDSYPEYLNPFAEDFKPKSKLSLSHSFKEFKRTLRASFRIKKKEKDEEEVTIRQKTDTLRRVPVSYPNQQQIAWPRSRFRERLSKCEPSTSTQGPNPFEDEEKNVKLGTTRRRGKKRAPLPPKSLSSQNVNDDNSLNRGSHWSLTSNETDYSESTDNVSRNDIDTEASRESLVEKFVDFNKEMEKLNDDSNNNIITKDEITKDTESNHNIPDLVISCPSDDTDSTKSRRNENQEEVTQPPENIANGENFDEDNSGSTKPKTDEINEEISQLSQNITNDEHFNEDNSGSTKSKTDQIKEEVNQPSQNITNGEHFNEDNSGSTKSKTDQVKEEVTQPSQNTTNGEHFNEDSGSTKSKTDEIEDEEVTQQLQNIKNDEKSNEDNSGTSVESDKDIVVTDITNNLIVDENNIVNDTKKDEEGFLYHEKKSLYIAGSRDELNETNIYTDRVSLYITGSNNDLDKCNNNNEVCTKYEVDENSNDDATIPVPKQRKNKLSKNVLLGM